MVFSFALFCPIAFWFVIVGVETLKKIVSTREAPEAIGPYSQAVEAGGFLFCSGQIPLDASTKQIEGKDIREQARKALENLQAVLKAGGSSLASVVKTTVFLKDLNDFAGMNEVYAEFFKQNPPARSTVQVARLPKDALVEIEAIARKHLTVESFSSRKPELIGKQKAIALK